jgi:hypothetical protein
VDLINMEIRMKKLLIASAIAASSVMTAPVFAATDGTVGGTSIGTLDIDVTIDDAVRISGLNDLIATFDGTNDIIHNDTACIYRNGTGLYQITAVGDGGVSGTDFSISDGPTVVAYTVNWNDEATPGAGVAVTSGTPVINQTGADTSSSTCGNTGPNSAVQLTILAADLLGAPTGLLEGTLSITVSPE